MAPRLTLVSRTYCHLCEEMERSLRELATSLDLEIEIDVCDVDLDPDLLSRFDELVPVLLHEGEELCHYHLDDAKVRDYLSKIG